MKRYSQYREVFITRSDMARVTQAHVDARKDEILEAASSLFLHRGFRDVTMQDIADEAGLSAGAIYRYYPGKDQLVRAFFEQCVGYGPAEMVRQIAPDAPPLERLHQIVNAVQAMWTESKAEHVIGEIQTSIASIHHPEEVGGLLRDAREQLYAALREIVEEGQRRGEIDRNLDPRALVVSLYAFVTGIGLIALEAGEEELGKRLDMMFGIFHEVLERLRPASVGGGVLLDEE
jgi:AcrR family transcriptional regulator